MRRIAAALDSGITGLQPEPLSGDGPARSDWGLDVLLDGILAHSSANREPRND